SHLFENGGREGQNSFKPDAQRIPNQLAEFPLAKRLRERRYERADVRAELGEVDAVQYLHDVLERRADAGGNAEEDSAEFFLQLAAEDFDAFERPAVTIEYRRLNATFAQRIGELIRIAGE